MSWVIGDHEFEDSAFSSENLPFPSLPLRLALISGQQIAYGGQTNLKRGQRDFYYRIFKRQDSQFSAHYRDKVSYIYYCRPAPTKVQLKQSTKDSLRKRTIDPATLVMPTQEDEEKLGGVKALFGSSDSDSDVSEECLALNDTPS